MNIESLDIKSLPRVRLSDRRNLPDAPGVYFVVDDRHTPIYYIGQAESLKKRWIQHNKIHVFKHYDSDNSSIFVCYLTVEGGLTDRLAIESRAIKHFVPLMNYQVRGMLYTSKPENTEIEQRLLECEKEIEKYKDEEKKQISQERDAERRIEKMLEGSGRLDFWDDELDDDDKIPMIQIEKALEEWISVSVPSGVAPVSWIGGCDRLLVLVSILNRYRMRILYHAGLVSRLAMRRGIGVGSQTLLDGYADSWTQGICVSEKLCINLDHIVSPRLKAAPRLRTSELFDNHRDQPKTIIC